MMLYIFQIGVEKEWSNRCFSSPAIWWRPPQVFSGFRAACSHQQDGQTPWKKSAPNDPASQFPGSICEGDEAPCLSMPCRLWLRSKRIGKVEQAIHWGDSDRAAFILVSRWSQASWRERSNGAHGSLRWDRLSHRRVPCPSSILNTFSTIIHNVSYTIPCALSSTFGCVWTDGLENWIGEVKWIIWLVINARVFSFLPIFWFYRRFL